MSRASPSRREGFNRARPALTMRRFSPVIGITSATVPMAARSQEDSHTLQALSEPATAMASLRATPTPASPLKG